MIGDTYEADLEGIPETVKIVDMIPGIPNIVVYEIKGFGKFEKGVEDFIKTLEDFDFKKV